MVDNSKLYQQEGIIINSAWSEGDLNEEANTENAETTEENEDETEDDWDETQDKDLPPGTVNTLLQPQDLTDEARQIYSFAAAKGNTPISIFMDKNSEELSFPT